MYMRWRASGTQVTVATHVSSPTLWRVGYIGGRVVDTGRCCMVEVVYGICSSEFAIRNYWSASCNNSNNAYNVNITDARIGSYCSFSYFCNSFLIVMKELLIRSVSGLVLATLVLGCIFASPWAYAVLLLFIVIVGTFEMARLQEMNQSPFLFLGEICSVGAFICPALVALQVIPQQWLVLAILFTMLPFLIALFSKSKDVKHVFAYIYGALFFLSLPTSLMLYFYREDLFVGMAGPGLIVLVFCLLWANDIFAYLTGKLLGKHKLFSRISPGKTIEGSLGGLVFTIIAMVVFAHYADWLPIPAAIGMAAIAVVFGTLGDLCESMLKRQAGVKDSGKLIPGHGGILDRFDSVMFSVPFIFVYLLLL